MKSEIQSKKKLSGTVVSSKSSKTIVVSVVRKFKHDRYDKFVQRTTKYHTHDEQELAKVGDSVVIIESRPHSRLKRWELIKVK